MHASTRPAPPPSRAASASSCGLCSQAQALRVRGRLPEATGRLRIDRMALRKALGGRAELTAAIGTSDGPKAWGRPTVDVGQMWGYFTSSVYKSGDLPVLATREALQNSLDAIRAAVKARQIRAGSGVFSVVWDPATRSLTWEDNGIAMDAETVQTKFLSLGTSGKKDAEGSDEAAGGFGVAKAVILGVSTTFRWEMHTRDNLAVANGMGQDVAIYGAEPRQGTRITVHDIDKEEYWKWDYAREAWVGLEDRVRTLLGANDLPGLRLLFQGEEVPPLFSRRGGSRVAVHASWGEGTTATVKAYRRLPGDRGGAYYVRLNGLLQHVTSARRGNLKADIVLDLTTTKRPGEKGYPLTAARDELKGPAANAFQDLVAEVEREAESVGRSDDEEVIDPDDDETAEAAGELGAQLAEALADEAVQQALEAASGGLVAFYQSVGTVTSEPVASAAPAGSRTEEEEPFREIPMPPGFKVVTREADLEAPSTPAVEAGLQFGALTEVHAVLAAMDQAAAEARAQGGGDPGSRRDRGILTQPVELALASLAHGHVHDGDLAVLGRAVERAQEAAMEPGGGGLLQATVLGGVATKLAEAAGRPVVKNPFGAFAGIRINKKSYNPAKARRFKLKYGKWTPYLLVWDGVLRMIAAEARIRRKFKPGFVLDDNVRGLAAATERGSHVIYIHPDRLAEVVKAHKRRPLAVAAYLHGIGVHELAHLDKGLGQGHDESFASAREDLGAATGHLLPAIAALATRLLGLEDPDQARQEGCANELARARGQAEALRGRVSKLKREVTRCQKQAPDAQRTPGTRLAWATLGEWLTAMGALESRRISGPKQEAVRQHLAALPVALVEQSGSPYLEQLERIVRRYQPPKGQRAGHHTTLLLDAIDRTRARAGRDGRQASLAEQLLDLLSYRMLNPPPGGLDARHVRSFLARRRGELLHLLETALGA